MFYHNFDLSMYFNNTTYNLHYFDVLLKDSHLNKDVLLNELGITPSTYRRCRSKEQNIGIDIIKILETKYNINKLDKSLLDEYEFIFDSSFNNYYYKSNFDTSSIDLIINENNYLKPIFMLLKILSNMSCNYDFDNNLKNNIELLNYVSNYKKMFTEELLVLYYSLEVLFGIKKDVINHSTLLLKHPYITGLYYKFYGYGIYKNDFSNQLLYLLKAKEYLTTNINALIDVKVNIANINAYLGQLDITYTECLEVLALSNSTPHVNGYIQCKSTLYHTLIQLNKKEYLSKYINNTTKDDIDYFYLMLLHQKEFNEIYDEYKLNSPKLYFNYEINVLYKYFNKEITKNKVITLIKDYNNSLLHNKIIPELLK